MSEAKRDDAAELREWASRRVQAHERFVAGVISGHDIRRCGFAAHALMQALRTGDYWWVGFADVCVDRARREVKARAALLANVVAGEIRKRGAA